ncbi:alpha-hydroxy acid oxidase [Pontibacter sp. JAM-7]|uniref:alpha-hydroxy acid oxidase n=1 Tax=Pontibacter sp. JAM-7 TaxID=3366581 RepID=UPI003AF9E95B
MSHPAPALQSIPSDLVSLADYRHYARQHLPHDIYEYIAGGGADEISLKRNRNSFEQHLIQPRILRHMTEGSTRSELLGQTLRYPVLLAPVAFQHLAHPEGEMATARAANALDTGMVVSTLASTSMEQLAATLEGPKWFQLYFQQDRDFTLSLVRRAEAAGYSHLMVTVDAPLHGIRNRAQRAGFELPPQISAVNLIDRPPLPRKVLEPEQSIVFQGMMSEAPTWSDINWLLQHTRLPVILKGVLHPDDAVQAKQMGIDGIVISNHGGRTLDCVPAALDVLPKIRECVGEKYAILLDGGIERGTDIFKALALGANAVLIGRPQVFALAVAGALGVAHMLRLLREELEVTMALAGTPRLADINADCLIDA